MHHLLALMCGRHRLSFRFMIIFCIAIKPSVLSLNVRDNKATTTSCAMAISYASDHIVSSSIAMDQCNFSIDSRVSLEDCGWVAPTTLFDNMLPITLCNATSNRLRRHAHSRGIARPQMLGCSNAASATRIPLLIPHFTASWTPRTPNATQGHEPQGLY